jgi:hypothetical protein
MMTRLLVCVAIACIIAHAAVDPLERAEGYDGSVPANHHPR